MKEIFERIDSYLKENFVDLSLKYRSEDGEPIKYSIGHYDNRSWIRKQIDKILDSFKQTFPEYLLEYIAKRGFSEVEVYKKAHLDRRIFSKLRNEKNYMPSVRTLWAIAFAMEPDIDEATELLRKGGFALTNTNKEDLIIRFFFENKIYDLFLINEVLDLYGFKPLN